MNNKYGGQLVYVTHDDYGPIEVVEIKQKLRSLHFGNKTQQAAMFLYNPVLLMHKYTQAMLTSLCWKSPEKVLVLGIGGGSIPKYLLHKFSAIEIDAVELRPEVTRIAQEYFSLVQDERLHIHHESAEDFLNSVNRDAGYDLVIVDLFLTAREKDVSVDISEQFVQLEKVMSEDGILCLNVIGNQVNRFAGLSALKKVFGKGLYCMSVDESNIVLLATNTDIPSEDEIDFTVMEHKMGLPFRQYFGKLTAVDS